MYNVKNCVVPKYEDVLKAVKGRKGLRTAKPKENGFYQYVWRMCRFHAGIDMTMPVNCEFDFLYWFDTFQDKPIPKLRDIPRDKEEDYRKFQFGRNLKVKEYREIADKMVEQILDDLGYNKYKAALIWGRALGML